jgi:beta-phosphoglucomutase-like phosphatase (HAD superfamily)
MLLRARDQLGLSLENSVMVGDKDSDVEAGRKAGCKTILYRPGSAARARSEIADAIASSWPEVVRIIARGEL